MAPLHELIAAMHARKAPLARDQKALVAGYEVYGTADGWSALVLKIDPDTAEIDDDMDFEDWEHEMLEPWHEAVESLSEQFGEPLGEREHTLETTTSTPIPRELDDCVGALAWWQLDHGHLMVSMGREDGGLPYMMELRFASYRHHPRITAPDAAESRRESQRNQRSTPKPAAKKPRAAAAGKLRKSPASASAQKNPKKSNKRRT